MNTVENINKVKRIRGYGEGSVYQRKDGRWVGKYKDEKMLKPRYVYGKTEAEARRKLREFKKTIVHGITDCRKVLLSTYIERWLYTFKAAAVENTSFDRLESVYYTHIKPTLGGFQLGNIKAVDIQTLLNQKSTEYSYTIVKMIRQILSEVFQHAYTEGDILKNPMANVIMAKRSKFKPERKMLILEDAEVKRLEEAAREKYGTGRPLFVHGNLIVFMLHTCLRCGELLALEWSDIDWVKGTITVRRDAQYTPAAGIYVTSPKNGKPRTVDVGPNVLKLLKQLRIEQAEKAISRYVFTQDNSPDIMHPQSPTRYFKKFGQRYSIEDFHPHKLRHPSASIAITNGADVVSVSERLGHSDTAVTLRMYAHANEESIRRAGQIVRDALKAQDQ